METINELPENSVDTPAAEVGMSSQEKLIQLDENTVGCSSKFNSDNLNNENERDEDLDDDDDDEDEFFDVDPIDIAIAFVETNQEAAAIEDGLGRLMERQRNELALELRRLQFSNTQVTESRNRLERLFTNRNPQTTNVVPQPTTGTFRSELVLNEIAQLSSQQRVSSLLSSSVRQNIERSLQQFIQNRSNNQPDQVVPAPTPQVVQQQAPPLNNTNNQLQPATQRVQQWLQISNPGNTIEQITREQILSDIGELVHRQLVSNTLQSQFRNSLEQRIRDHIRRAGIEERPIPRFNAPRANNPIRNDFTNLGINNNQANDDNLDSASSNNEFRARRSALNSREIRELKTEVSELKNLLKLSFELQLDMQRSFKQEISALISNTFTNSASASLIRNTKPFDEGKCIICTEINADTVFYECGHLCACYSCSMNLKQKNHNCPVCRAPIKDIVRTYKSSID